MQRDGKELAIALDTKDGKELWATPLGPAYKNQFGNGPRSTPTVEVAATAVDGVRERFRLRLGEPEAVWHFDSLLEHVFRTPRAAVA